jgi:hypothetical protein
MATYGLNPRTLRGALVSVASSGQQPKIIEFQYNPSTLQRTLQPQMVGGEENDRSQAVRFIGAPIQTINVDIYLDATDQLDKGDSTAVQLGIYPQLSALELLAYPTSGQITHIQTSLEQGAIEVVPMTAPRTLFVWGPKRVLPVRLTSYSITEEIFDAHLNPLRATVSIGMRVLNYSDLNSSNPEYHQFQVYQNTLESMASQIAPGSASQLGVDTS